MKPFALAVVFLCALTQSYDGASASDQYYGNGTQNAGTTGVNAVPTAGAWQDTALPSATNNGVSVPTSVPIPGTNTTRVKYPFLPPTATSSSVSLNVVDTSNMAAPSPSSTYSGALGIGGSIFNGAYAPVVPVLTAPIPLLPAPIVEISSYGDGATVMNDSSYSYTDDDYGTEDDY
jgi:hypothetical protein